VKQRLFLTGASGLLGRHLLPGLLATYDVLSVVRTNAAQVKNCYVLDLTDGDAACAALDDFSPDIIVHAAALANVDQCEKEQAEAWRLNVEATRIVADWCAKRRPSSYLVYISTDQVYDGAGPHREGDENPGNVYALTKLWGEQCAARAPRSVSLRTNFFMRNGGLAGSMERALASGASVTLFKDVMFNPLFVDDLADILFQIVETAPTGVINLGAAGGGLSKAEFVRGLAKRLGLPLDKARLGRSTDAQFLAYRPSDMRMDVGKLTSIIGKPPPSVGDGLDKMCLQTK
jgi:dTDP-4-dehydrorhamnose reductase